MNFISWKKCDGFEISRESAFSLCFDGMVKCFRLRSDSAWLNKAFIGNYYLDYFHESSMHLLLREISSESAWPKTSLVVADKIKQEVMSIFETTAAYPNWPTTIVEKNSVKIVVAAKSVRHHLEEFGVIVHFDEPIQIEEYGDKTRAR